jgi:hypothetical protein
MGEEMKKEDVARFVQDQTDLTDLPSMQNMMDRSVSQLKRSYTDRRDTIKRD